MGLTSIPPTREEVTTSAGIVKASTVLALQDAVVAAGALKELNFHAGLWQYVNPTNLPTYAGGVWTHPGAGGFRFVMPLLLPVGALVQEITVGYFRGTGTQTVDIIKHTIAAVAQTIRNIVTDNTGAAYETTTVTASGAGLAIGGGVAQLVIESGAAFTLDSAIAGGVTGTLGPVQVKYYPPTA